MNGRDTLRAAVVATNQRWPFSRLNKLPYLLALRAFVHLCSRYAEVKSVYLRHGMLRDGWIPAISDIDVTLVLDGSLTTDREFAFLESFWGSQARLQTCFPMLRDVNMLNERQVASWTRWTIRGYEARDWRLIHGTPTVSSHYAATPARVRHDAFNHALCLYLDYFLERFYADGCLTDLRLRELERFAGTIARYAEYSGVSGQRGTKGDPPRRDPAGLLSWLIRQLDESAPRIVHITGVDRSLDRPTAPSDDLQPARVLYDRAILGELEVRGVEAAVECIYRAGDAFIVVLKSGLDDAAIRGCASIAWHRLCPRPVKTMILTRGAFEYALRAQVPFLYSKLGRHRELVCGRDRFQEIDPPSELAFTDSVVEQMVNVLMFPRRRTIFSTRSGDRLGGKVFERELGRSLSIRLYLDTGSIPRCGEQLLAQTRAHYGEYYRRLGTLCDRSATGDERLMRRALFGMFDGLAHDLHQGLEKLGLLEAR